MPPQPPSTGKAGVPEGGYVSPTRRDALKGGSAEGWLGQYGWLGATAFRSGASLGGPERCHYIRWRALRGGRDQEWSRPLLRCEFRLCRSETLPQRANHCPSKTDCNTRDALFAGCPVSSLTAADLRRSQVWDQLLAGLLWLFPETYAWAISILVDENHTGPLEGPTYGIEGDVPRFTASFELPNSDKANVRCGSELLLRPVNKSASGTALSRSDHLGQLTDAVHLGHRLSKSAC